MNHTLKLLISFVSSSILLLTEAKGFTTEFFPGDSHFTTALSQRSLKHLKSEKVFQLDYHVFAGSVMFCGTAGFSNIKFEGDSKNLKANYLKAAIILFEKYMPDIDSYDVPSLIEDDYFPVFIYNRNFDFKKTSIGPRYNENWEDVQLNLFGLKHAIYPGFSRNRFLLYADFLKAKKIPPLDLILPLPKIHRFTLAKGIPTSISTPVQIKASKVQILILAGGSYETSKFAKKQPRRTLFRITEDSIERFETDFEAKWHKVPFEAPRNKETDKVRATYHAMEEIGHALSIFGYRHGWRHNPPLSALVTTPPDFIFEKNEANWVPLFKKIPPDGWGNKIMLTPNQNSLFSSGPDGKFHTADDLYHSYHN